MVVGSSGVLGNAWMRPGACVIVSEDLDESSEVDRKKTQKQNGGLNWGEST